MDVLSVWTKCWMWSLVFADHTGYSGFFFFFFEGGGGVGRGGGEGGVGRILL